MKKLTRITMMLLMALGIFTLPTNPVFSGEHGGSTIKEESGGTTLQGTKDDAATLKEAAAELKWSNPALAAKLEKMATEQCAI